METSVLFMLNADVFLPPRLEGFWSRGAARKVRGLMTGSDSVEVPCRGVTVKTRQLGPVLVAVALWRLREDGAIDIFRREPPEHWTDRLRQDTERAEAVLDRAIPLSALAKRLGAGRPKNTAHAAPGHLYDTQLDQGLITISPADPKEREAGLERTLLELIRSEGRVDPEDLARLLSRNTWDRPTKAMPGAQGVDVVKAAGGAICVCIEAAIEAGLLADAREAGEGAGVDIAGWRVVPDCERIAATRGEFERAMRGLGGLQGIRARARARSAALVNSTWDPPDAG